MTERIKVDFYNSLDGEFYTVGILISEDIATKLKGKQGKRDRNYWQAIEYLQARIGASFGIKTWKHRLLWDTTWYVPVNLENLEPIEIISIKGG